MDNVFGIEIITVKCPIMDFMWMVIDISMARPPEEFNLDSLTKVEYHRNEGIIYVDIKRLPVVSVDAGAILSRLHKHDYLPITPPFIIGLERVEVQRTEEIIRFYVRRVKT